MIRNAVLTVCLFFGFVTFNMAQAFDTLPTETVLPEVTVEASLSDALVEAVTAEIAKAAMYPPLALMRKWEGVTILRVSYKSSGAVQASVETPSGYEFLDQAAVRAAKDADVRAIFGPDFHGTGTVSYLIPVRFELAKKRS